MGCIHKCVMVLSSIGQTTSGVISFLFWAHICQMRWINSEQIQEMVTRREKTLKVMRCRKQPKEDSTYAFIHLFTRTGTLVLILDSFTSLNPSWIPALLCVPPCPQMSSGAPWVSPMLCSSPLPPGLSRALRVNFLKCTSFRATSC